MHPLVRDLYKRALVVGKDYPHPRGLEYVREQWKRALRDPLSVPSAQGDVDSSELQRREIRSAVGRGRYAIREMVGVIQFKKYRAMRKRYGGGDSYIEGEVDRIRNACIELARKETGTNEDST